MQLYALDLHGKRVFVAKATSGRDYYCLECKGRVRLRQSERRKSHFFHIALQSSCRFAAKSATHIALQEKIQLLIGESECEQEVAFKEISRIADLAWHTRKIVIEIQCSPISKQEVEARCNDYESCGWQVVWILHEKSFNHHFPTACELYLRQKTHYYANAAGEIYDQIWEIRHKKRFFIDISTLERRAPRVEEKLPQIVQERLLQWPLSATGDLLWQIEQKESRSWLWLIRRQKIAVKVPLKRYVIDAPLSFFRSVWHLLLEKSCR